MAWDNASPHFDNRWIPAAKASGNILNRHLRPEDISAGKDINRRIPIFGPGVNGDVRFGNHDHAAHTERIEFMKGGVNDSGLAGIRRANQDIFDDISFFQRLRVTTV